MRVVAVHEDVVVAVSRVFATACVAVRSGDEALVIDSPVYPDELDMLPTVLAQARFEVRGLLATHGDWDHLLGRLAFPGAALGVAETTAARLRAEPGDPQRKLRAFDDEHYVERPGSLGLGQVEPLPVPGKLEIGEQEAELHPADGHTQDGMAIWLPWTSVLIPGDFLSPVEIPMLSAGGSLSAYRATLRRLEPLVERAGMVVPGHGGPIDGVRAAAILREDLAYLDALERDGERAALPLARRTAAQAAIHRANVERVV
jgi:glyoxylase-like metal-dependent hydrolase (beta-lactamase superfamily II)